QTSMNVPPLPAGRQRSPRARRPSPPQGRCDTFRGPMTPIDLSGKTGIVFGVANKRSLAWGIARELAAAGARLAVTHQGERLKEGAEELPRELPGWLLTACDVGSEEEIDTAFGLISREFGRLDYLVHSVAFARKEDLEGAFLDTPREGFDVALSVSAYSLVA